MSFASAACFAALTAKPRLPDGAPLPHLADGATADLAAVAAAWAAPLGWLVCRCDDLAAGQRALLGGLEACCADGPAAPLPPQLAPVLKALCEADALSDAAVLAWADAPATDAGGRRARKFAAPAVDWLRTAEVVEAATEGTGEVEVA